MELNLSHSIEFLAESFSKRNWRYLKVPEETQYEKVYAWHGLQNEEIKICVYKGTSVCEPFHRQDFFFFNFAYLGDYSARSGQYENVITVREGECYVGQPFSGYALDGRSKFEIIIVGVLIRRDAFFKRFLSTLATD